MPQRRLHGTGYFVKQITKLWNILSVKSPVIGGRLNDKDRFTFTDPCDERLVFIGKMATAFKQMDTGRKGNRIKGLTSDTSNALHVTLTGIWWN